MDNIITSTHGIWLNESLDCSHCITRFSKWYISEQYLYGSECQGIMKNAMSLHIKSSAKYSKECLKCVKEICNSLEILKSCLENVRAKTKENDFEIEEEKVKLCIELFEKDLIMKNHIVEDLGKLIFEGKEEIGTPELSNYQKIMELSPFVQLIGRE